MVAPLARAFVGESRDGATAKFPRSGKQAVERIAAAGGGAYDYLDGVFFVLYCSNKPCQSVLTDSQKEITAPLPSVRLFQ